VTVDVSLWVALKGVDLVARTAYLTLVDKMGMQDNLLAIKRLDAFTFAIETDDPDATVSRLSRFMNVQSTFYNRNKHNYFLQCRWEGDELHEGVTAEALENRLVSEVRSRLQLDTGQDLRSHAEGDRVMFENVPVFCAEVLVEDREDAAKKALARKLEAELATAPVTVSVLGTSWYLALRAESEEAARELASTIVVTERRDRGLLLNPNDQIHRILRLEAMDLSLP
jgi:hypothetical protein